MKSGTTELLEQVTQNPEAFFVTRKRENYNLFLDLYQQVGYAPVVQAEVESWRERSRKTWELQDSLLPGNCTGGVYDGKVVSAFGVLPMTKKALWGHSVCMIKTLDAAATLYAQALHSIKRVEESLEAHGYISSYAHKSRFTALFQRPLSAPITDQLELEVIGLPLDLRIVNHSGLRLESEPFMQNHLDLISERERDFLIELSSCNPQFDQIYKSNLLTLKDAESGLIKCLAVVQNASSEVTAANVFSWTWIFPAAQVQINSEFVQSLRSVPELGPSFLQIVLRQQYDSALDDLNVPLRSAFWAVTPKRQLNALRESYREAFLPLFAKYSSDEVSTLVNRTGMR